MNPNSDIAKALSIAFATLLQAYPTKVANRPFNTPNNSTWVNLRLLPGGTFETTLSTTDRINGIMQVDVMMPKNKGDQDAYTISDILTSNLPKNGESLDLQGGNTKVFIRTISVPRLSSDDNWHRMIIDVAFYAFVPRIG